MPLLLERWAAFLWNRYARGTRSKAYPGDLVLGTKLRSDDSRSYEVVLRCGKRAEHIALLGKTGSGKTSLLRLFCRQDIRDGHGFIFFDLHGQVTEKILADTARQTRSRDAQHTSKTVIVEPADRKWSVGINVLRAPDSQAAFVKAVEIVDVLRARWHLDTFGARTEELLRNAVLILMHARLTLLELEPLLTDSGYRRTCLRSAPDGPSKQYFEDRFERLSAAMKAVVVEPVLNKVTAFSSDPHIRHIVGQDKPALDFREVFEEQLHVIINLDKGRLGTEAYTLGSLILTEIKAALFGRRSKKLFTIYCDEIQNLVAYDRGLESLFAEARKFGVSIVSTNQYLDQLTPAMRAALLSASTQLFFQLSGPDAERVAYSLGEPRGFAQQLRSLPQREFVALIGNMPSRRCAASELIPSTSSTAAIRRASNQRWAASRELIEQAIRARQTVDKELNEWD